jgi:hypothetical protein
LTGKFEAEPTIGSRDEDCCCHRMLSGLRSDREILKEPNA